MNNKNSYLRLSVLNSAGTPESFKSVFSSLEKLAVTIEQDKISPNPIISIQDNKCKIYPAKGNLKYTFGYIENMESDCDNWDNPCVKVKIDNNEFYFYSSEPRF